MMDEAALQRLATLHRTTPLNVAREYCQHFFLATFYRHRQAGRVLFKGGTALRIVYGSPRFSEDLDFSGFGISVTTLEDLVTDTLGEMERAGLGLDVEEAKPTSGGYLSFISTRMADHRIEIQLEISLRHQDKLAPHTAVIAGSLYPAYTLLHLPEDRLVAEKLQALAQRGKARDFYDLYFMLRRGLLTPAHRKTLSQVSAAVRRLRPETFQEMKSFLPKDQHAMLKDFRGTLERELRRFVG